MDDAGDVFAGLPDFVDEISLGVTTQVTPDGSIASILAAS